MRGLLDNREIVEIENYDELSKSIFVVYFVFIVVRSVRSFVSPPPALTALRYSTKRYHRIKKCNTTRE
jgi:hypothetical protein